MKILYSYVKGNEIFYIPKTKQNVRVLLWFEDDGNWYLYYADDMSSQSFINRIINKTFKNTTQLFDFDNLEIIESEDQFNTYFKWIQDNYNYNGIHKGIEEDV